MRAIGIVGLALLALLVAVKLLLGALSFRVVRSSGRIHVLSNVGGELRCRYCGVRPLELTGERCPK
jgi:hypothetical protein